MDPTSRSAADKLGHEELFQRGGVNRKPRVPGDSHAHSSCTSTHQVEFLAEICLHFSGGLETLDKPLIWVYPQVVVCLDCGSAQFSVPEAELKIIQENL